MDKFNFVKDGAIKLPPGFRFQPTDEEIVFQYLIRKTFSCPLPASIIPEINICKHDPWDLPGDIEQDRYFFSNKEAKYNGADRASIGGYWKPTGLDKQIICNKRKPIFGMKKTLVFYKGKSTSHAYRTDWIMHEYRLVLPKNSSSNFHAHFKKSSQSSLVQIGNWVLCHIFLKKRNEDCNEEIVEANYHDEHNVLQIAYYNFMSEDNLSDRDAASSCSSSLSINDDANEVSSCPNSLLQHQQPTNPPL